MLFSFRKVSKERKESAQAWVNEIKEYLNANPIIENWYVALKSGFLGYGIGSFRCDGDASDSSLIIHTYKGDKMMDVHFNLFVSIEEIEEGIKMAVQERTKNATGSYWIGGPKERYYHTCTLGKSHPDNWDEIYQSEWIAKNKAIRKVRKYINKSNIEIPEDISHFDVSGERIKLVVMTRTFKINQFVDQLSKIVDIYATY